MKKIALLCLVLFMLFSCSSKDEPKDEEDKTQPEKYSKIECTGIENGEEVSFVINFDDNEIAQDMEYEYIIVDDSIVLTQEIIDLMEEIIKASLPEEINNIATIELELVDESSYKMIMHIAFSEAFFEYALSESEDELGIKDLLGTAEDELTLQSLEAAFGLLGHHCTKFK